MAAPGDQPAVLQAGNAEFPISHVTAIPRPSCDKQHSTSCAYRGVGSELGRASQAESPTSSLARAFEPLNTARKDSLGRVCTNKEAINDKIPSSFPHQLHSPRGRPFFFVLQSNPFV